LALNHWSGSTSCSESNHQLLATVVHEIGAGADVEGSRQADVGDCDRPG
jgi:hypothetical protein